METITVSINQLRGILRAEVKAAMAEYHSKITGNDWDKMPNYVSRKQAADLLNISTDTIDRHCRSGVLEAKKIGKSVRISRESLMKYLTINKR